MSFLNRRAFLKSSALGVPAAAAMASLAGPAPAAPPKPPAHAETYRLTREIPVEAGYDLVVAGGGPAGAAAAISAARLGAKVLLVEGVGCLGGMGTSAYVSNWYSLGDGHRLLVGGLIRELIEKLCREGHVSPATADQFQKGKYLYNVGFHPESLKLLLDKLCHEAGVEVRFFTRVIDADVSRAVGPGQRRGDQQRRRLSLPSCQGLHRRHR